MGLAASQARLLALQSRENTQDTKELLNAIKLKSSAEQEKDSLATKRTETSKNDIQDKAEISDEALKKAQNNIDNAFNVFNETKTDNTAKANATEAKAIKAYRRFAS